MNSTIPVRSLGFIIWQPRRVWLLCRLELKRALSTEELYLR